MPTSLIVKFNVRTLALWAIIASVFCVNSAFALEEMEKNNFHSPKKKERIDMIKKIKLLEVLGLDEAKSEKFLAKFNSYDNKINENREKHREISKKLDEAIATNNVNDMKSLSSQLVELHEGFSQISSDKTKDIRTILSEVEFAKYINFENKFMREFFDSCMNKKYKNKTKKKSKSSRK